MDGNVTAAIIGSSVLFFVEVVKFISAKIIKSKLKKKAANDMTSSTSKDVLIKAELAKLRDTYKFNRVSIIEYHNGVTTLGGISLKKASMTIEIVDTHTHPMIKEYQSIPCSIAAEMLEELETTSEGYVIVDDESDVENTAIANRVFGIKQALNFRIGERLIDGCLSCMYTNDTKIFKYEDILEIKASAKRIFLIKNKI